MKKYWIFLLLLLVFQMNFGQNSVSVYFNGHFPDSYKQDFHLYRNDSLIYAQCDEYDFDTNTNEDLNALKKGTYQLKYNTLFGVEAIDFELNKNEDKVFSLDNEELNQKKYDETYSVFEQMKDGEVLEITYAYANCFSGGKLTISLMKKNHQFFKIGQNKNLKPIKRSIMEDLNHYDILLQNIDEENKLDDKLGITISSCVQSITYKINEKPVLEKHFYCGLWKEFSEYTHWLEQLNKL